MKAKRIWLSFIPRLVLIVTIAQILGSPQASARDELADRTVAAPLSAPHSISFDMVGHLGGNNGAVFVQGNYAYATFNQELTILNIADPAHPTRVGYVALPNLANDVYVVNGYAYLTSSPSDLIVLNVSDPTRPIIVGSVNSQITSSLSVHIVGNYAYLVGENGLAVINISNPVNPTEVGYYSLAESRDIFVVGNYAYIVTDPGLKVMNVSNPTNPTVAGTLTIPGTTQGIYVAGGYAYVTTEVWNDFTAPNLYVVNVSNPANPTSAGSVVVFSGFPGQANGVYVSGNYAYIVGAAYVGYGVGNYGGIQVVDVSTPTAPKTVQRYTTSDLTETYHIHISGNYAFLTGYDGGLLVMNVSNPSNPTRASLYRVPVMTRSVAISGNYIYLADDVYGIKSVNISNPALPFVTGFWKPTQPTGVCEDIAISGQYAYVADTGALRVLNISDPANLVSVTNFIPPGQTYGTFQHIHISGNYAYLIGKIYHKLWIVNITNFNDVFVVGNYAYVAGDGGLWVLDVSNPAQPTQVGYLAGGTSAVYVAGNYAYVIAGTSGDQFQMLNVSNPANPSVVGTFAVPQYSANVYVSGNYAYVPTYYQGLWVLDISTPANPTKAGEYATLGDAEDARVAGNYIYIADGDNGLVILTTPALRVSPAGVTWMAKAGGANPPARTVNVGSTGSPIPWTAALSPAVGWLNAAPLSGTSPTNVTLTANIAGLSIGQYNTQLIVTAGAEIGNSPQTIPITLIVAQEVYDLYLPLVLR